MLGRILLLSERRTQISILLTIIALLLWSHSMLEARLEIGYLGLIHSLPITFFIALVFLTAASAILWLSRENHGRLLCLQLLIFVSMLWLVPVVTGGSHPFTDETYAKFGLANYVAQAGHFSPGEVFYLSWPGTHILLGILANLGPIDYQPLIPLLMSLTPLLFLLPLYLFLKNVIGREQDNYHWAGLWLFSLASWVGVVYLSPQGIGYFLLLTMLALVTIPAIWKDNYKSLSILALVVVVFAALMTTHLLTALAALCILAALCVVKRSKRLALVLVVCLVLLVSWDLTGGGHYINYFATRPIVAVPAEPSPAPAEPGPAPAEPGPAPAELSPAPAEPGPAPAEPGPAPAEPGSAPAEPGPAPAEPGSAPAEPGPAPVKHGIFILDPDVITQREVTGHFAGSESHMAVARIRLVFSSIFALIGLAGAILFLTGRRNFRLAVAIIGISLAPLVLLPLSGYYAQELITRLYLFALPGMAFFGAMLLDMRSKIPAIILCVLMVIGYPLHIIAHYGNQEIDFFPPGHVAGLEFFSATTSEGYIAGGYPLGDTKKYIAGGDSPDDTSEIVRYTRIGFNQLNWGKKKLRIKVAKEMTLYVAISYRDRAWYGWFLGDDQFISDVEKSLERMVNCNLIYDNPVLRLYVRDVPRSFTKK